MKPNIGCIYYTQHELNGRSGYKLIKDVYIRINGTFMVDGPFYSLDINKFYESTVTHSIGLKREATELEVEYYNLKELFNEA